MKRLIVTGLPCPPQAWERLFGEHENQKIISLVDILEHSRSSDLRELSRFVTSEIETFAPDSIIAHDMGVPMTLMSLLRLNRRGKFLDTKVTLFNGAFRKVNIFRTNQPIRAQYLTYARAVEEIHRHHGEVDERLKPYHARIRKIYRRVILFSLMETASTAFGLEEIFKLRATLPVKNPIQIIASKNDPYIDFASIEQLRKDFSARRIVEVDYGHFPYSVDPAKIIPYVDEFEKQTAV